MLLTVHHIQYAEPLVDGQRHRFALINGIGRPVPAAPLVDHDLRVADVSDINSARSIRHGCHRISQRAVPAHDAHAFRGEVKDLDELRADVRNKDVPAARKHGIGPLQRIVILLAEKLFLQRVGPAYVVFRIDRLDIFYLWLARQRGPHKVGGFEAAHSRTAGSAEEEEAQKGCAKS